MLFLIGSDRLREFLTNSDAVWQPERCQAEAIQDENTLQQPQKFLIYLAKRLVDSNYTFSQRPGRIASEIEE